MVCVRFVGFFIAPLLVCSQVRMGNVATVILENTLRATASSRIVISDICSLWKFNLNLKDHKEE
jgi:hypothetical protein